MIKSLDELKDLAKNLKPKRVIIASAEDKNVINAIIKVTKLGLIAPIFVGNSKQIKQYLGNYLPHINVNSIWHADTPTTAAYLAAEALASGQADLLMKGLVPTKDLLKQILLKELSLIEDGLLSHFAFFESPYYHKLFGITDAAMNISPNLEEKRIIIQNSLVVLSNLGIQNPKVAILAAIAKINKKMVATLDARALQELNKKGVITNCIIEGPLALDNAISREAAQHKSINSKVAGDADLLVVPDIQSGNILYKSLTYLGNARCASLLLGAKKPIILTSRTDSEETKFFSIILGVLAANHQI